MNDPRNRYKIYQNLLDAMVNIIDSIRLTATEKLIEQDMVTIRRQIRSANYTLDNMIQSINEGWTFAEKKPVEKPVYNLGFTVEDKPTEDEPELNTGGIYFEEKEE